MGIQKTFYFFDKNTLNKYLLSKIINNNIAIKRHEMIRIYIGLTKYTIQLIIIPISKALAKFNKKSFTYLIVSNSL